MLIYFFCFGIDKMAKTCTMVIINDVDEVDVRQLILDRGLGINELARKIGLSSRSVYRLTLGKLTQKKQTRILLNLIKEGVI